MLVARMKHLAPSATVAGQSRARARRAQSVDVISFGAGEPGFDTPERVKAAAGAALRRGETEGPEVGGLPELRAAVDGKLRPDQGLEHEPVDGVVSELFGRRAAPSGRRLASSTDVAEFLLAAARVAVVPGAESGSDAHLRLSDATGAGLIAVGLGRTDRALRARVAS
jgi:aspartate/methionine/tyrosine aminotransferase